MGGLSSLRRVQTRIRDWQATVKLKELLICHGPLQLLSHFGLHANYLEASGECEIFPESACDIVTIYACATNKIVGWW